MTEAMVEKIKAALGLIMTLLSIAAVVWRWFKAPAEEEFNYEIGRDVAKDL